MRGENRKILEGKYQIRISLYYKIFVTHPVPGNVNETDIFGQNFDLRLDLKEKDCVGDFCIFNVLFFRLPVNFAL